MRGKDLITRSDLRRYRITPAYAGKSYRKKFSQMIRKDHPRLCGEKGLQLDKLKLSLGSPPPMRGKD